MNTIEKKSLRVGKYVNTEHVDNLVRNYKKERWIHNTERMGKEDSLGVWLSADELEEFVQVAKQHGADGIRLYFGVYGDKAHRPDAANRQTVAFVATRSEETKSGKLVHNDLYINREGKTTLMAYNMIAPTNMPFADGAAFSEYKNPLGTTIVPTKDNTLIVI